MIQDALLDEDFDLLIADGDFLIDDTTTQSQALLLLSAPGEWRQSPLVGVALQTYLLDNEPDAARAEIRRQFELDGMTVSSIDLRDPEQPLIDATYA